MSETTPSLRDFLDDWRVAKGWSIQRFADEIGVHQSLASKWLHPNPERRVTPRGKRLRRIAQVIGVPYERLRDLAEIDEETPNVAHVAEAAVQSELDARLARLRTTLSRYPRAVWLAVIEANEKMADALDALPEGPVTNPQEGRVTAPNESVSRDNVPPEGPLPNCSRRSLVLASALGLSR